MNRHKTRIAFAALCLVATAGGLAKADGLSAIKQCEADNSSPEDYQRLSILPNGQTRGSDTAATLVKMARQKAKEGNDAEAILWAALCQGEPQEQATIKQDSVAVLGYLKE